MLRRRVLFLFGSRSFEIREAGEATSNTKRWEGIEHALLWLRAGTDASALGAIRRFCGELAGAGIVAHLDDDAVLRHLAGLLASGRAHVVERPLGALVSFHDGTTSEDDVAAAPSPAVVDSDAPPPSARSWITIELVGEDDSPIANARYRIDLPDGSVREGRLDGRGLARIREIDPGQCVVTFPELDEEAWTAIGTTGEP